MAESLRMCSLWIQLVVILAVTAPVMAQLAPPDRNDLNAAAPGMLVNPVTKAELQLLAEVLGVPTERLGDLHACFTEHQRQIEQLRGRAKEIVEEHDLGALMMYPDASVIDPSERAAIHDRGVNLVNRELYPQSRRARQALLDCAIALCDQPDAARLRVFRAFASRMAMSSFGPVPADLCGILSQARRHEREYAIIVPDGEEESWQVALALARKAIAHREPGSEADVAEAVDGYLGWLVNLDGDQAKRKKMSWDERFADKRPFDATWKKFAHRRAGIAQHSEAISQAIERELGPEKGPFAALQWRRDVRAAGAAQFFGESELDRAQAFLKRLSLAEDTLAVVNLMHQSAIVRLEAADVGVESALAATRATGSLTPPGTPGAAHVDAACRARIKVLDEELDAIGAVLAGTEFEDRWRKWVIDLREKRDGPWDVH